MATTATANDCVLEDIKMQLWQDLLISIGSLLRESLAIQVIKISSKGGRIAWILQNINNMPGTGIIYCLTINDCETVNKWLKNNNINSEDYYSTLYVKKRVSHYNCKLVILRYSLCFYKSECITPSRH